MNIIHSTTPTQTFPRVVAQARNRNVSFGQRSHLISIDFSERRSWRRSRRLCHWRTTRSEATYRPDDCQRRRQRWRHGDGATYERYISPKTTKACACIVVSHFYYFIHLFYLVLLYPECLKLSNLLSWEGEWSSNCLGKFFFKIFATNEISKSEFTNAEQRYRAIKKQLNHCHIYTLRP